MGPSRDAAMLSCQQLVAKHADVHRPARDVANGSPLVRQAATNVAEVEKKDALANTVIKSQARHARKGQWQQKEWTISVGLLESTGGKITRAARLV